jgi:hypothetical protein
MGSFEVLESIFTVSAHPYIKRVVGWLVSMPGIGRSPCAAVESHGAELCLKGREASNELDGSNCRDVTEIN